MEDEAELRGKPKITVPFRFFEGTPAFRPNDIDPRPVMTTTDKTGPITCEVCLRPHPLRGSLPIYAGDSCTYPDHGSGENAAAYDAQGPLASAVKAGHDFKTSGRFGAKRFHVNSVSIVESESRAGDGPTDHGVQVDIATERISITFKRCPRAGRRPC